MKIKYVIIYSLLSTITFSQDAYPYFSNPENQLEFEKKRIYIKEFEEERQYISGGGDVFNWWSLLLDTEPIYKTAPITTSFYYDYTFEIIRNGIVLNEIEFLQFIELTELANNIIIDYKDKFTKYQSDMDVWIKKPHYFEEQKNINLIDMGIITIGIGLFIATAEQFDSKTLGYILIGGGILEMGVGLKIPKKIKHENPKPIEPVLKQHLTNDQIKSIAESHNRKIFNEISKSK